MRNKFVSLKNIFTFVSKIYLMTLKEAFSLLITQPLWYKNSDYIRQQAVRTNACSWSANLFLKNECESTCGPLAGNRLRKNNGLKKYKL